MSLTVGSYCVAAIRIQTVVLQSRVGAYELLFPLYVTVNPANDGQRQAVLTGAHVTLTAAAGGAHALGFARPDIPVAIRPTPFPAAMTPTFCLPLQPQQLAAIEDRRAGGDLTFELLAVGEGGDAQYWSQVQDAWRTHVPRSAWIETLRSAGALDILLLEVPMPIGQSAEEWQEIGNGLRRAQKHFYDGDYLACVAACRTVVEDVGQKRFGEKEWSTPQLSRLANNNRGNMIKDEREAAILAVVRHYTHQAHHAASEGGMTCYSRSEAKLVFTLTAALVAHVRGG